jgi:hypothetical protein
MVVKGLVTFELASLPPGPKVNCRVITFGNNLVKPHHLRFQHVAQVDWNFNLAHLGQ